MEKEKVVQFATTLVSSFLLSVLITIYAVGSGTLMPASIGVGEAYVFTESLANSAVLVLFFVTYFLFFSLAMYLPFELIFRFVNRVRGGEQ